LRATLVTASLLGAGLLATGVKAQQVDLFLGLSTARDGSNGKQIDTFGDGTLYNTPSMGGIFSEFGAAVFPKPQLGFGWTISWKAAHDYAGLLYHPSFNTFDAIFQPAKLRIKRSWPEIRGGLGFAGVHFDYPDSPSCDQVPGCPSTHHLLVHMGVSTRVYLYRNLFVRPAVDVQYINNFFLFGSNWVPQYSLGVGYSFGRVE
jgi:hypothetical protein